MKQAVKRLSALLLVLTLSLQLLGVGAWAADIVEDDAGAPGGAYLEETESVTEDTFEDLSEEEKGEEEEKKENVTEDATEEDSDGEESSEEESAKAQAADAVSEPGDGEEGGEAGETQSGEASETILEGEEAEESASDSEGLEETIETPDGEQEETFSEKQARGGQPGDVACVTTATGTNLYFQDFQAALAAWGDGCTFSPLVNYNITQDFTVPAGRVLEVPVGIEVGGTNVSITNNGSIVVAGTLNASQGTITTAGDVEVTSTGTLVIAAPLPTTAEMMINAGGELKVAMPGGTRTFIGKKGSTDAIAVLTKGMIAFSLTASGNTYTLGNGDVLNVYAWDTGNELFGTTAKTIVNKGTINVPGSMAIGENTTLDNDEGVISISGTLDATHGTISAAGDVEVNAGGTLVTAAPLPATAEMNINAGGEFKVALPDGQGGVATRTFIGKQGNTDAIAALAKGSIAFSLTAAGNTYTLGKGGILSVNDWDTGNALFGTTKKNIVNKGTINVPGSMSIGQNTVLNNDVGVISVSGTLDATHGTILAAGDVDVAATGTLITVAPLPATAEMNINEGGELQVVVPDGQGGTAVRTFIGKKGSTDAIATLEKGSIEFSLSEEGNTYTLKKGGILNVYAWDTGNALFGTTKKAVKNKGTINVPGTLTIGQNTTLTNTGTLTLTNKAAYVLVYEASKGELTVGNSDGGVHSGSQTKYSYYTGKASQSAPAAPVITGIGGTSLKVKAVSGQQYSIDGGKTWKTPGSGAAEITFSNLNTGKRYTVFTRKAETAKYKASPKSKGAKAKTLPGSMVLRDSFKVKDASTKDKKTGKISTKITVSYGKMPGATGYEVYVQYCAKGGFSTKPAVTVKGANTTSVTIRKINGKAIKAGVFVKVYVAAKKGSDILGKSSAAHIQVSSSKYTDVKSMTLNKTKVALKEGKTFTIKAALTLLNSKKQALSEDHTARLRFASSDKSVATVDAKGKVTAIAQGTCVIQVTAQNGITKKLLVRVQ